VPGVDLENTEHKEEYNENCEVKCFRKVESCEHEDVDKQVRGQEFVPFLIRIDRALCPCAVRVIRDDTVDENGENHAQDKDTTTQVREPDL
jgi:hypothetical protein